MDARLDSPLLIITRPVKYYSPKNKRVSDQPLEIQIVVASVLVCIDKFIKHNVKGKCVHEMYGFRQQNQFLVYLVNFSGLYLKSIESLTDRKWLLCFLAAWTKIAIIFTPIYIGSVVKFLIFDEASFTLKMAVFRRVIAFSSFLFKNVFFYIYRRKIEDLIDLWDSFFKEDFYSENLKERLMINRKQNVAILSFSWILTLTASLTYTVPPFFSKSKTLSHPSGIPYRHQSPDYELMIVFDFFRVVMACLSSVSLDCILIVFLSYVLVQLKHLKDCLTHLMDEFSVEAHGHMTAKTRERNQIKPGEIDFEEGTKKVENGIYKGEMARLSKNLKNGKWISESEKDKRLYEESVREFDAKLRIWILHHQQIIRFFDGVKTLFTPVASLQLVYVVFYTCFTAFHLVRAKPGIDAFVIPVIAASSSISLFVWCYMGVQIDLTSSQIFGDAFGRCWFRFPKKTQRAFSFIIMRGWKPLVLKGISLFDINLSTFFQVFKITYQLFAFLLQVAHEE